MLVAINQPKRYAFCLALGYLKSYLENDPFLRSAYRCVIGNYSIEEFEEDDIIDDIAKEQYDIIGFSCYSLNVTLNLRIAERLKKLWPECLIVLGGPEVSEISEKYLVDNPYVDIIARGEGEVTFSEIARKILEKDHDFADVEGITYWNKNEIKVNKSRQLLDDLDKIPSPYLNESILLDNPKNIALVETFRGCRFKCTYCYEGKNFPKLRHFSVERIIGDIKYLIKKGITEIWLINSTFNYNKPLLTRICKKISEVNSEKKARLVADLRAEYIDSEVVELLKSANVVIAEIGLQAVNKETLENIKRPFDRNKFIENFRLVVDNGFKTCLDVICGLPGDNFFRFARTMKFVINQRPVSVSGAFLEVLPGTEMRESKERFDLVYDPQPNYEIISNYSFSADEIRRAKIFTKKIIREYHSVCID